jgi:small subunit ribosomal protein S15
LDRQKKGDIVKTYAVREGDSGSTEVQVALLTDRIKMLTGHMTVNRHDFSSQRGLLRLVGSRRRLLAYLSRQDPQRYQNLIGRLGLRK